MKEIEKKSCRLNCGKDQILSGQLFVTSNESLASFFVNTSEKQLNELHMVFIIPYLYSPKFPDYCSGSTHLIVAKNIYVVELQKGFVVAFDV